jgi:hypothetical protein
VGQPREGRCGHGEQSTMNRGQLSLQRAAVSADGAEVGLARRLCELDDHVDPLGSAGRQIARELASRSGQREAGGQHAGSEKRDSAHGESS